MEHMLFALIVFILIFTLSPKVKAATRWDGYLSLEDTFATNPEEDRNLFKGNLLLDIRPPTKKKLNSRINIRLNYSVSDKDEITNVSPIGNLGADMNTERFSLSLEHRNFAIITTEAELIESRNSRAAFALTLENYPQIYTNYFKSSTVTEGKESENDTFSFSGDYRYKWAVFRGNYTKQKRVSDNRSTSDSDAVRFGMGGSYEILPKTVMFGNVNISQFSSVSSSGFKTKTITTDFISRINNQPFEWLDFQGIFSKVITKFDSETDDINKISRQNTDFTANLFPLDGLRIWTTIGNRIIKEPRGSKTLDSTTIAASFDKRLQEYIEFQLTASRTDEDQSGLIEGTNRRDNYGLHTTMDIAPSMSVLFNFSISRTEFPTFIEPGDFDSFGTLAERVFFDDRPEGFTFFDTDNSDVYTKNTSAFGDWSEPENVEPVIEKFSVNKNIQLHVIPTDHTNLTLSYSSSSSSDDLDIKKTGNQGMNISYIYTPNRKTSYSVSGGATFPEKSEESYSATGSMAYRFFRDHRMQLSYSRREFSGELTDSASASIRLSFRKRVSINIVYTASQLFDDEQRNFVRARFNKYF